MRVYLRPATPTLKSMRKTSLNFFFVRVPPLQAAFSQSRSEPVKVLHCRFARQGGACGDL